MPTTHRSHRPCHSQPTKRRAPLAHERREDCRILAVTRNTSWRTAYIIGRNNRSRVREHRAIRSVAAARLGIQRSTPFTIPQNSLYVPREREREKYIRASLSRNLPNGKYTRTEHGTIRDKIDLTGNLNISSPSQKPHGSHCVCVKQASIPRNGQVR